MTRVYVVAAYAHAPAVRAIHDRLRMMGIEPVSSWAEEACGEEDLNSKSDEECQRIWRQNCRDMDEASIVLVLADTGCREGFHEAERALELHSVVWVGRPTLSARNTCDVWYCATVDDALAGLEGMVRRG